MPRMRLLVDGAQGRRRTSDTYRAGQPSSREAGELGLASHVLAQHRGRYLPCPPPTICKKGTSDISRRDVTGWRPSLRRSNRVVVGLVFVRLSAQRRVRVLALCVCAGFFEAGELNRAALHL